MDRRSWTSSTSRQHSSPQQSSDDVPRLNEQLLYTHQQTDHCRGSGMMHTLIPGTLTVLSAYPDPPFDIMKDGIATGFDIELMRAVCSRLSLELRPLAYTGDDFNGIFAELAQNKCDVVISGTTITPERAALVRFSRPYLKFNQGIAINRRLTPDVTSTEGLRGLTAG